jgi:hypothetical protein
VVKVKKDWSYTSRRIQGSQRSVGPGGKKYTISGKIWYTEGNAMEIHKI